jgi:hypothetical protein
VKDPEMKKVLKEKGGKEREEERKRRGGEDRRGEEKDTGVKIKDEKRERETVRNRENWNTHGKLKQAHTRLTEMCAPKSFSRSRRSAGNLVKLTCPETANPLRR